MSIRQYLSGVVLMMVFQAAWAATGKTGEEIYQAVCQACHASGVGNAPVTGDSAAWQPRLAKGLDTLYKHAVDGLSENGVMPPMGMCMQCSAAEVKAAVDYMLEQNR